MPGAPAEGPDQAHEVTGQRWSYGSAERELDREGDPGAARQVARGVCRHLGLADHDLP